MSSNYEYLYSKENVIDIEHYSNNKLNYKIYKNGYFLPHIISGSEGFGGICDKEGNFVRGTHVNGTGDFSYSFDKTKVKKSDEKVIYLGIWHNAWGHCITDDLKLLWFLFDERINGFTDYTYVYDVTEPQTGIEGWTSFLKLLEIIGIDPKKMKNISEVTQFEEIVVPDESFFADDNQNIFYTNEYKNLIDRVRKYSQDHFVPNKEYEKIYLAYKSGTKDKNVGLEKFEPFFASKGYKIIYPEKYTLEEQLNMFWNCKELVSTIGSCSHNSIFLREHTKLVLIPRSWYLNPYQDALNEMVELDVFYIDSSLSLFNNPLVPTVGPMYFFISEELLRYYDVDMKGNNKFWKRNLKDLPGYLDYGFNMIKRPINPPRDYNERFFYYYKLYNNLSFHHKAYVFRKKIIPFIKRRWNKLIKKSK